MSCSVSWNRGFEIVFTTRSGTHLSFYAPRCSDGDFLQPDEVAFAVLLRGYGGRTPPDWPRIDATLTTMKSKFDITPTASESRLFLPLCCFCPCP